MSENPIFIANSAHEALVFCITSVIHFGLYVN